MIVVFVSLSYNSIIVEPSTHSNSCAIFTGSLLRSLDCSSNQALFVNRRTSTAY
nr:MAG TPA: hypothetical protein [Caudoviricetes sp.]